jgi:heme/copper-type cytochrome/quinol oxidase subunit 4
MADANASPHGGEGRSATRAYTTVAVVLAVLTVIAFALVLAHAVPLAVMAPVLLLMAAIQVYLQADVYMHLRDGRRLYRLFFTTGVVLALIVVYAAAVLMWLH